MEIDFKKSKPMRTERHGAGTLSITILRITIETLFRITTTSITTVDAKCRILLNYSECSYAGDVLIHVLMLSVLMLSVVILSVVGPKALL